MEIAKAVILAGDCRGPDPWPSLGLPARQLAPVANKPVLFHHLETLAGAGVREAAVATDEVTAAGIREALGDGSPWKLDLSWLDDEGPEHVVASPEVAAFAGEGPVVVLHGDALLHEPLEALEARFADAALDALILRLAARTNGNGSVPHVSPTIGYLIGADVRDGLRREAADDPATGIDEALTRLRDAGARIDVRDVDASLPCRGRTEALLEANRRMLGELASDEGGERVFDTEIQGRVAIHPSAEVRDSLIRGPVAIGPGASVANAYIGPYTSIGSGVQIDAVEIEHSIILDGARIRFVGSRIEGSLIGPGAHIERDFRVPQAVRLWVGAGSEVALS